ncbi:MAG TPA: hypothetical protein VE465_21380 [Streptosporangiaceae bacterium]|jgi:hypothetical protein|nr:hypothetical protein [Streptosporangiaceae bacterium]
MAAFAAVTGWIALRRVARHTRNPAGNAVRFHHSHGAKRQPILKCRHEKLGLGRIFLDEVGHHLKLLGRGAQPFTVPAPVGLNRYRFSSLSSSFLGSGSLISLSVWTAHIGDREGHTPGCSRKS